MKKLKTGEFVKLKNIHPDTARKWAASGKVKTEKDEKGHLLFLVDDSTETMVTNVIFVVDKSDSMCGLQTPMNNAIESQLEVMRNAPLNTKYNVGTIFFGSTVEKFSGFSDVKNFKIPSSYTCGMTALYDAMGVALDTAALGLMTNKDLAYLIVVITDGQENQSRVETHFSIKEKIKNISLSGRMTIVANCPVQSVTDVQNLGIPHGNVRAWEQTFDGVQSYAKAATLSASSYTTSRSAGVMSSNNFYVDLGNKNANSVAKNLATNLNDVTKSVEVVRVPDNLSRKDREIRNFAKKNWKSFEKGSLYYQLTKKETVQPYKKIIVQDKKTGKFYEGWDSAKSLLNISNTKGDIKLTPGNLGEFSVFIQSTSYTRQLTEGTAVLKKA